MDLTMLRFSFRVVTPGSSNSTVQRPKIILGMGGLGNFRVAGSIKQNLPSFTGATQSGSKDESVRITGSNSVVTVK